MKKEIEIQFIESDFEDTEFLSIGDCALCRATKRATGSESVAAMFEVLWIGNEMYSVNPPFVAQNFSEVKDALIADPTSIHKIKIIKEI